MERACQATPLPGRHSTTRRLITPSCSIAMRLRPFRNDDPPRISRLWRRLPPSRLRAPTLSVPTLESLILSKPYFDRAGMIVAEGADELQAVVHAGFGTDRTGSTLSHEVGVVAALIEPQGDAGLRSELLDAAEAYLAQRGAQTVLAGGVSPHHPFYLGLYGGALLPGIAASDESTCQTFAASGYSETGRRRILRRSLAGFRPPVDRDLIRLRRLFRVVRSVGPARRDWWDACTIGVLHRTRFELIPRDGGDAIAAIEVWDMEPLASGWGTHGVGVCLWHDANQDPRLPTSCFLLGEAMRQLLTEGSAFLEVHLEPGAPREAVCRRLGFEPFDEGCVLTKTLG